MYELDIKPTFWRVHKKLTQKNLRLTKRTVKTLQSLEQNPSHPSLKSHKVETRHHGFRWSSWVSGDIRVIWDFDSDNRLVILVLTMGGHSGKGQVYK